MIPGFSDGNSLINGVTIPQGVILPTHLLKMKDAIDSRDPQLDLMTLSQFISMYFDEITECLDMVYGEELHTFEGSQNEILLLVDNVTTGKQHCMTKDIRRRYRKSAGKQRRERMDNLYDYRISPFNRIHAVASLSNNTEDKDGSGLERRSILSLDFIISSVRSNRFGVGSYLMETIKIMATYYSYSDIVLEVANNVGDDIDEDENEEDDSEIFDIEYPDDYDESEDYSITHLLKNELTKKCQVRSKLLGNLGHTLILVHATVTGLFKKPRGLNGFDLTAKLGILKTQDSSKHCNVFFCFFEDV